MSNDLNVELSELNVRELLESFKKLDLASHYDFNCIISTPLNNGELIAKFIKSNRPLIFEISDSNTLYYKTGIEESTVVFDVDVTKSFSKSDSFLYDKLIPVPQVFPTIVEGKISNEMSSFFICLVIASVFGESFEDEFIEVSNDYDFLTWCPKNGDGITMTEMETSWIQLGSKYVKMVASAAKYALVRERQKKRVPLALQLPQDVVLELNKTIRDVDVIRYEYDEIRLSPIKRESLTKLEIKSVIAERDRLIHKRITSDTKIYQIWRLTNLNSNCIPPNLLLTFNRLAKAKALTMYQEIRGCEGGPVSREDRLAVKVIETKCKKTLRRAYLNKLYTEECAKFRLDRDKYVAPGFL